jgi:hypothetical protein
MSIDPGETGDLREEIARLEDEIETLARRIERCRKIALAAKAAAAVGAILLAILLVRLIRFDALAMIVAVTATIGGIVVFGSNAGTTKQLAADLKAAESHRAELIGRIDLRPVGAMHVALDSARLDP